MEGHAKVVVIGGGVVGCSILYHLAKFGLEDCILLERKELTAGSSWHAAGNIHVISSDPNISRMMAYTINLYKEIEKVSRHSVGLQSVEDFISHLMMYGLTTLNERGQKQGIWDLIKNLYL